MTFLDDNGRFVITHGRGLGDSDIGVPKRAVHASVFEPNGASANIPIFATSGQEINTSSPTLAPLLGGRFLVAWVQKRADTFATTPSVRARMFSGSDSEPVGQEVQVNTTMTGDRFSACAATIVVPGEGATALVAWADDSRTGNPSDFAVRGGVLPILASGVVG